MTSSTTTTTQGKKTVYVGGLAEEVDDQVSQDYYQNVQSIISGGDGYQNCSQELTHQVLKMNSVQVVRAAFIPFGDLVDVQIPLDYETEKHRGFAFVEFELQEDAQAAIENMVSCSLHFS